jgi:site-specific DNA-methyltransferase (adenine-specific)
VKLDRPLLLPGDCLDVLPLIPDGAVDAVICDPPYGTTACKWDSIIPFVPMWAQLKRIIKPNGAIVMTASQPFTSALIMSNLEAFRHEWIWVKNRGSNFATLKTNPFKEHENILVFSKERINFYPVFQERSKEGATRVKYGYNGRAGGAAIGGKMSHDKADRKKLRNPSSVQKFNTEVGLHPTQKPVALMEYLIQTYTNGGDTVLDFAMGSGTTGVACKNLGRNFIGIEKDDKYFPLAVKRIGAAHKPDKLDKEGATG